MDGITLEDLVLEYTEACKQKARFLQEYAGPPRQPHKHMTLDALGNHCLSRSRK